MEHPPRNPTARAAPSSGIVAQAPKDVSGAPGPRTVLFSAVRNEAPFLLEWVAYHRAIGFDEIVICSNPSTDGTEDILAALAEVGEITHLRTVPVKDQSPQMAAVAAYDAQLGYRAGDWYLWIDADEFLNVHVGDRSVRALTTALGARQGIMLNWRIFGSNGHATFPGRFISPDFRLAAAEGRVANLEIKTLFRAGPGVLGFAPRFNHRPLLDGDHPPTLDDFLTGNGKPPSARHRRNQQWLTGADFVGTHMVEAGEAGWAMAQINHYAVRTPDFFALKRIRGRSVVPARPGAAIRYSDQFFRRYDRNESPDTSILDWADAVSERMAMLAAKPTVGAALAAAAPLVAADLAAARARTAEEDAARHATGNRSDERPDDSLPAEPQPAAMPGAPDRALAPLEAGPISDLLRRRYAASAVILEYGGGASTVLAAELGKTVFAVESDKAKAEELVGRLHDFRDRVRVHHADIGPTRSWGFPAKTDAAERFHLYAMSVWDRPDFLHPDLVRINGRFRAACLAAVALRSNRPVSVLFDDYAKRGYYHRVESLFPVEEMIGTTARFIVTPGPVPPEMLTEVIGWFADAR